MAAQKLTPGAMKNKAVARFKVLYPRCVDPYIKVAFVTGYLESYYSKMVKR